MGDRATRTPEAQRRAAMGSAQPDAPEAEAPEARGDGFKVATDGKAPTNGSEVAAQKTPPGIDASPNAPPPGGCPSGSGRPRLSLESLLKRKRSPCRDDGTRRLLKPRRYVATDE